MEEMLDDNAREPPQRQHPWHGETSTQAEQLLLKAARLQRLALRLAPNMVPKAASMSTRTNVHSASRPALCEKNR
jgi:hypothetical protein